MSIQNAKIVSTFLGREDHDIPTCFLQLDYDGASQSFGGYNLRNSLRAGFVMDVLDALEAASWEELPGTYIRVDAEQFKIKGIGHITKDNWFYPEGKPIEGEEAE